jgi:hypothetical protein
VIFLISIAVFARLLTLFEVKSVSSTLWTYSFFPLFWKNSAVTHDYILGLLFILLGLNFLLSNRVLIPGILFGIAVGCRLTNLIILIPVLYYIFSISEKKGLLLFIITLFGVSTLCYLPVFLRSEFLNEINEYVFTAQRYSQTEIIGFFVYRSVFSIGLLGVIAILLSLFINRKSVAKIFSSEKKFRFILIFITCWLLVFLFSPDEKEYLIPLMPFLIIFLSLVFSFRYALIVYICMLSYSFINIDIIAHGFQSQRIAPHISQGFVIDDYSKRVNILKMREEMANYQLPDSSVVIAGMGPMIWFGNRNLFYESDAKKKFGTSEAASFLGRKEQYIVYELSNEQIGRLQREKYNIFYIKGMKSYIESIINKKLDTLSIRQIDIVIP